jgi:hypothetical protein
VQVDNNVRDVVARRKGNSSHMLKHLDAYALTWCRHVPFSTCTRGRRTRTITGSGGCLVFITSCNRMSYTLPHSVLASCQQTCTRAASASCSIHRSHRAGSVLSERKHSNVYCYQPLAQHILVLATRIPVPEFLSCHGGCWKELLALDRIRVSSCDITGVDHECCAQL